MATEEARPVVLYEAAKIEATREALIAARSRIEKEAWAATGLERMDYGRLSQALTVAEGALFRVLNVAASRLRCNESDVALETWFNAQGAKSAVPDEPAAGVLGRPIDADDPIVQFPEARAMLAMVDQALPRDEGP